MKTGRQLDREINALITPYVDPKRHDPRGSGVIIDTESPWQGTAILNHFATGMFEYNGKTRRYEPVINGKPIAGAIRFSVDKINGKMPRNGTPEMKILRKLWTGREALARFVRDHNLDAKGEIRLSLTHVGGDMFKVHGYDSGRELGVYDVSPHG